MRASRARVAAHARLSPPAMAEPHVEEVIQGHADTAQAVALALSPDEEAFLLAATRLRDRDALRAHILRVQADAAEVRRARCAWGAADGAAGVSVPVHSAL